MTLPASAKKHLDALQLDPELKAIAERIYPSDDKDKEARERAEAERLAQHQQAQRSREELCQRCIDGEFGKEAKAAAIQARDEHGGVLNTVAVNLILGVIRRAKDEQRRGPR